MSMNDTLSIERKAGPLSHQYGSTRTISTEGNKQSSLSLSLSLQELSTIQSDLPVHSLNLDLSIVSSDDLVLLTGNSRVFSFTYSNISKEGG